MKAPDRNCMYCNQLMAYAELWQPPDLGPNSYCGTGHYIYMCQAGCRSQQDVDITTGKIIYQNFHVDNYKLMFRPDSTWCPFSLGQDPPDEPGNTETILELNFCPTHLTPQNTTEERIRLLLLFS